MLHEKNIMNSNNNSISIVVEVSASYFEFGFRGKLRPDRCIRSRMRPLIILNHGSAIARGRANTYTMWAAKSYFYLFFVYKLLLDQYWSHLYILRDAHDNFQKNWYTPLSFSKALVLCKIPSCPKLLNIDEYKQINHCKLLNQSDFDNINQKNTSGLITYKFKKLQLQFFVL